LLKVDDRPVARSADLDHGEPVRGGVGQATMPLRKAGAETVRQNARFLRQIAGDRRRVAGGLLVAEADVANALGLSQPRKSVTGMPATP